MKRLVPMLALPLVLAACGGHASDAGPAGCLIQKATGACYQTLFQLPVLPGRPGAGYFSVPAPADHGALIGVSSPQAGRIEMHETVQDGAISRMRRIERIMPQDGQLVLMQRGRHLMIFDVQPSLAAGATAQFVLRFEGGQTRTIEARVVAGTDAHSGH